MTTCPTCITLGFTCLRCRALAPADDDRAPDVEWAPSGPRCVFCSRAMHRWGRGWVCSCGQAIGKDGQLWTGQAGARG